MINKAAHKLKSRKKAISKFEIKYNINPIMGYLNKAAELLNITIPLIIFVPYLFDADGYVQVSEHRISGNKCTYLLAYFDDSNNTIYVACKNPETNEIRGEDLVLFTLLHELRHVWQFKNHHDTYYCTPNSVGRECIFDEAEIDADAFALYFIDARTPFSRPDVAKFMPQLIMDNGARFAREFDLHATYGRE